MKTRKEIYKKVIQEYIKEMYSKGITLSEMKEFVNEEVESILNNEKNTIVSLSNGIINFSYFSNL